MDEYSCTLWDYLKNPPFPIPMSDRFNMFELLLSGARAIQDGEFKHLDLKLGNVLINCNDDGTWNKKDLVITDFGLGGKNDKTTEGSGTPGCSSPEQFIGKGTQMSDNYAFGKMMAMLFAEWHTGWNVLYQPITQKEKRD